MSPSRSSVPEVSPRPLDALIPPCLPRFDDDPDDSELPVVPEPPDEPEDPDAPVLGTDPPLTELPLSPPCDPSAAPREPPIEEPLLSSRSLSDPDEPVSFLSRSVMCRPSTVTVTRFEPLGWSVRPTAQRLALMGHIECHFATGRGE
jgi:hypothetical protein